MQTPSTSSQDVGSGALVGGIAVSVAGMGVSVAGIAVLVGSTIMSVGSGVGVSGAAVAQLLKVIINRNPINNWSLNVLIFMIASFGCCSGLSC